MSISKRRQDSGHWARQDFLASGPFQTGQRTCLPDTRHLENSLRGLTTLFILQFLSCHGKQSPPPVGGFVSTARGPLSRALTNEWLASHAIVRQAYSQWEGPGGARFSELANRRHPPREQASGDIRRSGAGGRCVEKGGELKEDESRSFFILLDLWPKIFLTNH